MSKWPSIAQSNDAHRHRIAQFLLETMKRESGKATLQILAKHSQDGGAILMPIGMPNPDHNQISTPHINLSVEMMIWLQECPEQFQTALQMLWAFDQFSRDNDPYREHDCGTFAVPTADGGTEEVMFKFDYYDPTMESGSSHPANPSMTYRLLTLMTPSEY